MDKLTNNNNINSAAKLAETTYKKMKKDEYSMIDYYSFRRQLDQLVKQQTKVGGNNEK